MHSAPPGRCIAVDPVAISTFVVRTVATTCCSPDPDPVPDPDPDHDPDPTPSIRTWCEGSEVRPEGQYWGSSGKKKQHAIYCEIDHSAKISAALHFAINLTCFSRLSLIFTEKDSFSACPMVNITHCAWEDWSCRQDILRAILELEVRCNGSCSVPV